MKPRFRLILLFLSIGYNSMWAQSPGLIVRPQGGAGVTSLNPNGDGYSSMTTAGYSSNDITESELAFRVMPAAISEPTGDLSTGPSGGFSDIVTRVDGSGFYLFKDASNIYFRLRIGNIVSGSKGYSVLIDTDNKMGGSGPHADPNYIAPSGNSVGNPGFEYEVVFQTNFQVAVYSIDGTATPGAPTTFSLNSNSQIAVALSTDGNNPDYFYDWFVPLSAIGNPASIRTAVTTVTSPNSALQGTRSDIYGINDANFSNTPGAWEIVVNAQPPVNLTSFGTINPVCTSAPVLSGPIAAGSNVAVSGTWTRLDASKPSSATITLYKNGVSTGTTTVATGNTWNIVVASISNGDVFYAKALATGETECLQSNNITASSCITLPASPVLTCGSLKGISGTMPSTASGNTIQVYLVPTTSASPTSNLVSTVGNLTYPSTTSFAYFTNGCSGGSNNVATGVYLIVTQNGTCSSAPAYVCINSGSSGTPPPLTTNGLTLTTPIYPTHTSINGTGAATGDILRLYINGKYINSITTTGTNFSFTGLTLVAGDQIRIYSQTGTSCITQSNLFTVSCFAPAPSITVNATGNLLVGATTISGTSPSPGASVQLYRGIAPSGIATGAAATVAANGSWMVTVPALVGGDSYYAIQTVSGCASAASSGATVLAPAVCPTISGSYTDASTSVNGTMPSAFTGTIRLYLDGALIGSQSISAATNWSISVPANTLYYNGSISATAQASGGAESSGCASLSIGCTSPATPVVSPTSTTITVGNTVTYTINNVSAGTWYALLDNSGSSYATSLYRSSASSFNMTTKAFSTTGTYNLKITADALTGCPASFATATVMVNGTLPLNLLSFSGTSKQNRQLFYWTTSNEKNLSHFELQESGDALHYKTAARVEASSSTDLVKKYEFVIHHPLLTNTYYRLRMVDFDGKEQFSSTLLLKAADEKATEVQVSPRPFNDKIQIGYSSSNTGEVLIVLRDVFGRSVRAWKRTVIAGSNSINIDGLSPLQSGLYILTINDGKGQSLAAVPITRQ